MVKLPFLLVKLEKSLASLGGEGVLGPKVGTVFGKMFRALGGQSRSLNIPQQEMKQDCAE